MFSLKGSRAFVTGANAGIGKAIAVGLAEAGAEVVCGGRWSCDETVAMIAGENQPIRLASLHRLLNGPAA